MTSPRDTHRTKKTAAQRLGSAVTCLFAAVGSLTQVNLTHAEETGHQAFRLDQPIYVAEPVESPPKRIFNEHNQPHFRIDQPMYFGKQGNDQTQPLFGELEQPSLRRDRHRHLIEPVKNPLRRTDDIASTNQLPVNQPTAPLQAAGKATTPAVPASTVQHAQSDVGTRLPAVDPVASTSRTPEPRHPQFRLDQPMYMAKSPSLTSAPPVTESQERPRRIVEAARNRAASESINPALIESNFNRTSPGLVASNSEPPAADPQLDLPNNPPAEAMNYPSTFSQQSPLQPQQQLEQPVVAAQRVDEAETADWTEQLRLIYGDDTPIYVGYLVDNGTFQGSIIERTSLQEAEVVIPAVPQVSQDSPSSTMQSSDETYGVEPEDLNIQFLRTASVLLKQGEWQFDYGLQYAKDDYDAPVSLTPSGVARGDLKRRTVQVPFAVRYGLTDRLQLSAALPVGWSNAQFSSVGLFDDSDSQTGIGDLELGMNYHWKYGQFQCTPDVILSFGLTVPTGDGQFPIAGISQASLANDVWAPSVQMLFIHRYDPIVYYYGVGYRYQFEAEFDGNDVQYGQQFSYNLGVGFAVNDRVTLSTTFQGLFQSETEVNGLGVPGSIYEPLSLRFAVTSYRCGRIIEPYAIIGMTNDAADAIVGITWTL